MEIDLKGKTAIVTGAGRGIGRVIALTLGREGVSTVALDIREDELEELGGEFAARGYEGMQRACDVTGPWNITVNAYAPGMIPTELNRFAEAPAEVQERLLDTLTLRRWGRPEDVANLICFLASDLAGYITGALIDVSGGKLATQNPRLAYEGFTGAGYGY